MWLCESCNRWYNEPKAYLDHTHGCDAFQAQQEIQRQYRIWFGNEEHATSSQSASELFEQLRALYVHVDRLLSSNHRIIRALESRKQK
jgi:hypothetical protein